MDRKSKRELAIEKFRADIESGYLPKYIYRYRAINMYNLLALANNYLWFSNFDSFNDPFDGKAEVTDSITHENFSEFMTKFNLPQPMPPIELSDLHNCLREVIRGECARLSICCFSRNPLSIPMWAHYAESHTGMVLVFDIERDADAFMRPIDVLYERDFPRYDALVDSSDLSKVVRTKSIEWEYEQEMRILNVQGRNRVPYKREALTGVIFGCKTSEESINLVRSIAGEGLRYWQCAMSSREYKLELKEL